MVILQEDKDVAPTPQTIFARLRVTGVSGQPWHLDAGARNMRGRRLRSAQRLPAMRQQLVDSAVQVRWQSREHVFQIRPRVVTVHLVGVLAYPANWQLASLPKALNPEEVEQLVASLGQVGPSMRRADAMVRCALDLGLRSGEVSRLSLDDIDWRAGTITLRGTKGRREDVMPLPMSTGQSIVEYLRDERPETKHRMVFARHIAPRERPIGPALVGVDAD